jgi:hypothetical protein
MRTVTEEDRIKFLQKARAKKAQPKGVQIDPSAQLVVEDDATKTKKKRKAEQGRISLPVPSKGAGGEASDLNAPQRRRTAEPKDKGIYLLEGDKEKTDPAQPSSIVVPATSSATAAPVGTYTGGNSPWDPLFNPERFLENMVHMAGNDVRFNSTPSDELLKMSLGYELKGLLLNYVLACRQRQEISSAKEKMATVDQHLAKIEEEYTATKNKLEADLKNLKAAYDEKVDTLKKECEGEVGKLKREHAAELDKL